MDSRAGVTENRLNDMQRHQRCMLMPSERRFLPDYTFIDTQSRTNARTAQELAERWNIDSWVQDWDGNKPTGPEHRMVNGYRLFPRHPEVLQS